MSILAHKEITYVDDDGTVEYTCDACHNPDRCFELQCHDIQYCRYCGARFVSAEEEMERQIKDVELYAQQCDAELYEQYCTRNCIANE